MRKRKFKVGQMVEIKDHLNLPKQYSRKAIIEEINEEEDIYLVKVLHKSIQNKTLKQFYRRGDFK